MTQKDSHEERIDRWIRSISKDGGIERLDDLHVDQIDDRWREPARWVTAGLEALRTAAALRDRLGLDLTVATAFSLQAGSAPRGVDFKTSDDLRQRLDWSPPSLYLFRRGQEPWRLTTQQPEPPPRDFSLTTLEVADLFGPSSTRLDAYLIEFRNNDADGFSRTVFLAA
jgi:hypothetical protein